MYIEQSIQPVSPVFLRSDSTQFSQGKETFHDIFQRTLNHKSDSRPPKIELTGILIPMQNPRDHHESSFKLETDQNEYLLRMNESISMIANKLEWEEVTVKGYLDPGEGIFEVEKISLSNKNEPDGPSLGSTDLYFELDQYKKTIARKGLLNVATDDLAS